MKTWFVTGTDTEIGKTVASCALMRHLAGQGLRVAGLKPVASGCDRTNADARDGSAVSAGALRNEDALALMAASNVPLGYEQVNPYAFEPPIAPHLAASEAGVQIDPGRVADIAGGIEADWLIVEGVGGWCVPLDDGRMLADLAGALTREVVLVVGLRLGCINHALLSARQIERDGFELAGWIANTVDRDMPHRDDNIATLDHWLDAPRLGTLPFSDRSPPRPRGRWDGFSII